MSDFIAEARVLVTPDTTKFRALLEAQIATITSKPLVVPITLAATTTGAAAGAAKKAETAKQAQATATRALERAELALVAAEEKALLAVNPLAAARARLTGATNAVKAATTALGAAERSKNVEVIEAAAASLASAEAEELRHRATVRTIVLEDARQAALAKTAAAEAAAAKAAKANTAATVEAAGVERARITATAQASVVQAELASIQTLSAKAANDLAAAELRLLTTGGAQAKVRIQAASAIRAAAVQEEILAAALRTGNAQLIQATVLTSLLTKALAEETLAALGATEAQLAHAASLGNVGKAAVASGAGMLGLRGAVLTAGAGFIAATVAFQALGKALSSAIDFERQLNVFAVTAGATAEELERVSATARELGRDITLPGVSAGDAAETLTLLSRAGLDVNESLGAVRGTLQLATAAQIENAEATELVANALNAFKLEGKDAVRVADLFAGAANQSQGSITDMGIALRQASAAAAGLGLTVEDTLTLLTQLSRAGLAASDAGTSLRTGFLRLIQNLPKVNEEVERLGINFREVDGSIDPEFFEKVGQKLKTMDAASRQAAQANLGGADALRLYLLLGREAAGTFDEVQTSISKSGIAAEVAAAQTEGLGGDVEAAKNQMSELGLTVGRVASGPLSLLVRTAGAAAGAVNEMNRSFEESTGGQGFLETFGNQINDFAGTFARLNLSFQQGVRAAHDTADSFGVLGAAARATTDAVNGLADALENAAKATLAKQGLPAEGLNPQQILNRIAGFDAAEVRARISGDTAALAATLEAEQQFLIDQLNRQYVKNREPLRRALESNLLGVTDDLRSISKTGTVDAKKVADDAARAIRESERALLEAFSQRRDDAQRRIATAGDTEGLRDDIRRHNEFQALIKIQIAKVRDRIKDEQARKEAVRALRIALIESRKEEDALRQEQAQNAAAAKQESINLDITFAEITGNVSREIAARNRLIALLRKQQKSVKKGTTEWKRLRNEIAEQQAAIKDARDESDKNDKQGKSAQQFFFEQLQAQQGFAANLLGNLITGPTEGLVGVPSTPTPGRQVSQAAAVREGKEGRGPTSGQAATTNDILLRILQQLKSLNGGQAAPEAGRQYKVGRAVMDGPGVPFGV